MQKIEVITEEVVVTKVTFKTSDGEIYDNLEDAENHQKRIDGERITCPECGGTKGRSYWGEDGRLPLSFIKCTKCVGKGYLDKVTIFQ